MSAAIDVMNQMKATPRETLDQMQCGHPGCTEEHGELYLHGRCHINSNVQVCYYQGKLLVVCGTCKKSVVMVEVK
jgi:hypothetical protein